jgi:hypothetical protein
MTIDDDILERAGARRQKIRGAPPQRDGEKSKQSGKRIKLDPSQADDDPDLKRMNERFAVVQVGGKTRIAGMEESPVHDGCQVPVFQTIADFIAFHAVPRKLDKAIGREVGIGRWWVGQPGRRQYEGIVYAPGDTSNPTKLNLWAGFACEAREGDCSLYLKHLRDNICSENQEHYEYLENWMARAVQQPGRSGEVAVVLRGKEGTGKGVLAKIFGGLFGPHFRHVLHAKHLTGHFNSHLQHCSLLYADEAFFAGDRGHESILKGLITEETMLIEPKGLDPFAVRNCIHLVMSSNSDWVVPAGADARRYFMLDVSDAQKQRSEYFRAIAEQMDSGGREALLHYLLTRDLSAFDVRQVPQTEALADQKRHSRRGVDQLVEIIAERGHIPCAHHEFANVAITSGEENNAGFYVAARRLVPELRFKSSRVTANELTKNWGCTAWKRPASLARKRRMVARARNFTRHKH